MAYYTPTVDTDKQITRQEIYLFDAGTQYKGKWTCLDIAVRWNVH